MELQFSSLSLGDEKAVPGLLEELLEELPKDPNGCVNRASKSSNLRSRLGGGGDVETRRFLLRIVMLLLLLLLLLVVTNGAGIEEALILYMQYMQYRHYMQYLCNSSNAFCQINDASKK